MSEEVLEDKKDQKNTEGKASIGDIVQVKRGAKKGVKGRVVVIRPNSVIIEMGTNPKTGEPVKTVVNHKNYKKVK